VVQDDRANGFKYFWSDSDETILIQIEKGVKRIFLNREFS
jgi:hypothetical protein